MYGIIRIDREASNTHAWRMEIQWRCRIYSRNFSDQRHGGKRKALQAAVAYRDIIIATHAPLTRAEHCAIRKKNNRSGVSGVTRLEIMDRRCKNPVRTGYWLAKWPFDGGRFKQCLFSIQKYGERGAYFLAVRAREEALRQLSS
jgi:hypothetical protein